MIHAYRLCSFAPAAGYLRWLCTACPRVVHQHVQTGAIEVQVAGAESTIHGGREGPYQIFDVPEVGAFEVAGPWGAFLRDRDRHS